MLNRKCFRLLYFLVSDKVPYLLTILVVALGFTLTYVSGRVVDYPILEYKYRTENAYLSCDIRNISASTLFSSIEVVVEAKEGAFRPGTAELKVSAPTYLGKKREPPEDLSTDMIKIKIPELHPGASVTLVAVMDQPSDVQLRVMGNQPMRVEKANPVTWILKNHLPIMFWVIVGLVVMLVVYIPLVVCKGHSSGDAK